MTSSHRRLAPAAVALPRPVARTDEHVPVLVFSSGITALSVLGRRGLRPFAADSSSPLLRSSRWFRGVPGHVISRDDLPLGEALASLPLERAVLIACSDHWVSQVAALSPALRERFPASVPSPDTIQMLVDKACFADLLDRTGTPHPGSWVVEGEDDLARIPDDAFTSAIIKPRDSQRFIAAFGVKAFHARSRDEARARLAEAVSGGHAVIVQEYVPGPATNHYFVDGFIDRYGVVRATFVRRRLRMYPADFGNSSFMASVPRDDAAPAIESITSLLDHARYRGVFSAEFKRDDRDGEFKLLEVNARPWWYVDFAARCGVDVCSMAYNDALGRPVKTVKDYAVGRTAVYPYVDLLACVSQWKRGELSLAAWASSWLGSMQPVLQWRDPLPGLDSVWRTFKESAARRLRRV
jgi:predicted ATP-grasp superfamily ATP-dependent carboligase